MHKLKVINKTRNIPYLIGGVLAVFVSVWLISMHYNAEAKLPAGGLQMKQIAVGASHSCGIASNNKAYCWGSGGSGQLGDGTTTATQTTPVAVSQGAMPAGATILQLSIGDSHTCAVASDNQAYCWGLGTSGRLGNGLTATQTTPVAVSQGAMPVGATIRQISASGSYTCAIASDNQAYCWGLGSSAQMGNGTTSGSTTPVAVSQGAMPAGATILQISTGSTHACAIASDNQAYCWGSGASGRLGNGSTGTQTTPAAVSLGAMPVGATILKISAGASHTCAIASDNQAYCWGSGNSGRLGSGSSPSSQTTPIAVVLGAMPVGATILKISAGASHTCAIASDNKGYCWGSGTNGQLGDGTTTAAQTTPVAISTINRTVEVSQSVYRAYAPSSTTSPGSPLAGDNTAAVLGSIASDFRLRIGLTNSASTDLDFNSVSPGNSHSCAIASNNKAYCWGYGIYGELGNGSTSSPQTSPVTVLQGAMPAGATIKQIEAAGQHTCAIASDNKAYCWGDGADGELGNGTWGTATTPAAVSQGAMPAGATFVQLAIGRYHGCAIASDNKAYCWGYGGDGELGQGSTADSNTPVAVALGAMPAGSTIRQIATGYTHTCAIASDNKAYCWGTVAGGTLGDGSTTTSNTPVAVALGAMPAGSTIRQISVGRDQTCAVASDNKAYCWGMGTSGQLGNGSSTSQTTPVAVSQGAMPAGSTIIWVAASRWDHSCALASNNKVYCWGANYGGQLGNGLTTTSNTPVAVSLGAMPAGSTVQQFSAGYVHNCALASNNKAYCWGDGTRGRLGNGSTASPQTTPVAVSVGSMNDAGTTISNTQLSLDLQVAPLGAAPTCSAVAAGWTNVTTTSPISWGSAPPSHTTTIGSFGSDPTAPSIGGYAYQSVVQNGTFTNSQTIASQQTALWDFVLYDRSSLSTTSYCFRIVSNTGGTSIDTYSYYPQITTAAGSLDLQFVDSSGVPLGGSTGTDFTPIVSSGGGVQTSTGALTNSINKQLEAHNSTSNSGWSVSLAATGGPTAAWESGSDSYAYNAAASGDGQLTVDMTGSSHTAHGTTPAGVACSTANVTRGTSSTFNNVVSAITLLTGSASAQFNCNWRVRDIVLSQTVPSSQAPGSYVLDMTATIVAN